MRKCRTSSLEGSEDEDAFPGVEGGGVATFSAKPNAPGNELESRTTNVPGGRSFSIEIAATETEQRILNVLPKCLQVFAEKSWQLKFSRKC
jgi:hypothetical protein